jgi:hypothetical protein
MKITQNNLITTSVKRQPSQIPYWLEASSRLARRFSLVMSHEVYWFEWS